jgi:hypothetical protein
VPDLVENFCAHNWVAILKDIFVHLNNACPHNSRQSSEFSERFRAHKVPHHAYSSDPVSSDFFLSGYLKTKLAGLVIRSREELISTIRHIFDEITREKLISVYLSWKKGLKWVIKKKVE